MHLKKLIGTILLCALSLFSATILSAQNNVSGKVTDQDGNPIVGVTVMIPGTTRGVSTDANGTYSLNPGNAGSLEFSCLGYKSQSIDLTGQALIDIIMDEDLTRLDESVVVGYGVQKRRDIVGAIETFSTDEVQERFGSSMSISRALQGTIPGLTLSFADGKPNRSTSIQIRGVTNSIGAGGDALVLLDGIEVDMNDVNPDDIETVTVLKDASSTAVYGARGTFGVILMTSKKGVTGKTKITYDGTYTVYQPTFRTSFVSDGYEWATAFLEAYRTAYNSDPSQINDQMDYSNDWYAELERRHGDPTAANYRINSAGNYEYFGSTDWYNMFYKKAWSGHQHNLTASGSTDKASYYVSGRFFDQEGQYKIGDENWKQWNLMAKGTVNVKPWLRVGESIDFTYRKAREPGAFKSDSVVPSSLSAWFVSELFPIAIPYNPDGTYTQAAANGYEQFVDNLSWRNDTTTKFGTKTVVDIDIIKDVLTASVDFGFKYGIKDAKTKSGVATYSTAPGATGSYPSYSFYQQSMETTQRVTGDATVTSTPRRGDNHSLTVLGGWNIENYMYRYVEMYRNNLMTDDASWNLVDGDDVTISDTGSYDWGLVGAFYRLSYNYKSKYILETSGRYDGNSKFPSNQRWGFFPSGSAGWRISEEGFMQKADWLDNLKIRVSAGESGNGLISDAYAYMSTMALSTSSGVVNNGSTFKYTTAPDPIPEGLTWEKVITYDVGLDFEAFAGRLNFVADYYRKNTNDMYVVGEELPAVYGNSAPKGNYADMKTNGWEVSLSWRDSYNVGGKSLAYYLKAAVWDSRSFLTRYTSKTGTLPTPTKESYYEGMEIGEIWGFVCNGFYQTDEEAQSYDLSEFYHNSYVPGAGFPKYEDLNGDGVISDGSNTISDHGDMVKIGNTSPRFQYSLQAGLSWNGIGLSFMFQGVGKRDWYPSRETDYFWGMYNRPYGLYFSWFSDRWSEDNRDGYWPRLIGHEAQNGILQYPNTRYLQRARYLRLKNVTVDYNFPTKLAQKIGLQGLKIYVTLENPLTFTPLRKYAKNYDPEGLAAGDVDYSWKKSRGSFGWGDGAGYDVLKSYTIGLTITL